MTYKELSSALMVFDLGERASLKEIRARHRELVKRHHPDADRDADPEVIRKVNTAYRVLMEYVLEYRFSFGEEEFYEQNPDERLRKQFFDEEQWGSGRG